MITEPFYVLFLIDWKQVDIYLYDRYQLGILHPTSIREYEFFRYRLKHIADNGEALLSNKELTEVATLGWKYLRLAIDK